MIMKIICFLPLTSNLSKSWVIIDNSSLEFWILNKESIVIIPKIWMIHKSLILENIWKLKNSFMEKIQNELCKNL